MKKTIQFLFLIIIVCLLSCKADEDFTSGLKESNLNALVQKYSVDLDAVGNNVIIETDAGCTLRFSSTRFTHEGNPVTGNVDIEVIEIFDKGTMAITGKHTMTDESILISGGEFFVKAYQGDNNLEYDFIYRIVVPTELTGGFTNGMDLFTGGDEQNSSQNWVALPDSTGELGVFSQDGSSETYLLFVTEFQWFNCDKFLDDPRPLIDLDVKVPSPFNQDNSIVYLAIKGEPSSLGIATQGKYPLGMEAHLIFASEVDDALLYQIISGALSEDEYKFERDKMQSATPAELKEVINNLE